MSPPYTGIPPIPHLAECAREPAQVAHHGAKAAERQRRLRRAGITYLHDAVKGGRQRAVVVAREAAKEDALEAQVLQLQQAGTRMQSRAVTKTSYQNQTTGIRGGAGI